ncbi:MAG: hypothetical protein FJX29_07845, partial [Alphaproteobacteria bacterium]|nr:hypothetical protein [Alphaproteobacteria bacterium]
MAFLPAHGVPPGVLLRALELSRQQNVRPETALLAQGLLPERDYFAALARHLGLELADDDPGSFGPDA